MTRGDLWVADADGTHRSLLVRRADQPAWGPNGGASPSSAPAGSGRCAPTASTNAGSRAAPIRTGRPTAAASPSIATARPTRLRWWYGGGAEGRGRGTEPAYAPDGRLASSGTARSSSAATSSHGPSPDWSPDGRLAWVRDGMIYVAGRRYRPRFQPAWRPGASVAELLPDFDQRAPSGLVIAGGAGRWLLGFTSLVDNLGPGSSVLVGVRPPGASRMTARSASGSRTATTRRYADVGRAPLHELTAAPSLAPDAVRLVRAAHARRPDARPRPQERLLPRRPLGRRAGRWPAGTRSSSATASSSTRRRRASTMGTSPGYTDRYPAFFHGQNVDITGVPAGIYDLSIASTRRCSCTSCATRTTRRRCASG